VKINVGCGFRKIEGFVNLDIDRRCNPDILCDITAGLPYKDGSLDYIYTSHCLEHMWNVEDVIKDFHRVLKPGGVLEITVPYYPGRCAVAGDGHVRFFTMETFSLYCNPRMFQPKGHPSDIIGLFDQMCDFEIRHYTTEFEKKGNKVPFTDVPFLLELYVKLMKVDKAYWIKKDVTKDLDNDVLGCFFCQWELVKDVGGKKCPECGTKYTFKERV